MDVNTCPRSGGEACMYVCVVKHCKHGMSRYIWIDVKVGTCVGYVPKMCPIVFGDEVRNINEWAGQNAIFRKSW